MSSRFNKTFFLFISSILVVNFGCIAQVVDPDPVSDTIVLENELVILESRDDALGDSEDYVFYQVNIDTLNLVDSIPIFTAAVIERRLSSIESTIPLRFNSTTKGFIDYFTIRNRGYSRLMMQRRDYFFPMFEKYLKKHDMPIELKYLAVVESGLQPKAISRVGAAGLWQFMPSTGRVFKLSQDVYIDERLDPEKATEAACLYLKELYQMFGNWELAIASYNCGPGNIRKAIKRSGGKKDFWKIYNHLPRETRSYLPQFIALAYTLNFSAEHMIYPESFDKHMAIDTIYVSQYIDLELFSTHSGLCMTDLLKLNPELRLSVIPPYASNYPLRIPAEKSDFIRINFEELMDSSSSKGIKDFSLLLAKANSLNFPGSISHKNKVHHTVRSGDAISKIAQKYGVSVSGIKSWNNLKSNDIRIGQRLIVYTNRQPNPTQNNTVASKQSTQQAISQDGIRFHYVQPGDTLWDISRKYEVTVDHIKKINNLSNSQLKVGMKLKIS